MSAHRGTILKVEKRRSVLALGMVFMILGGIISAVAHAAPQEGQEDRGEPSNHKPGDLVRDVGVGAVAPQPGNGVYAEAFTEDGIQELVVVTEDDGDVVVSHQGDESSGVNSGPLDDLLEEQQACNDSAYNLNSWKESDIHRWYFNAGSTPSNLGVDATRTSVKNGAGNITNARNNCGLADNVSASHSFQSDTTTGVNIDANGNCTSRDAKNVVSFGDLPAGTLGVACSFFDTTPSPDELLESDIKLNKVDHSWTNDPALTCSGRFDVESVMTHERGHTFGMGHVGETDHGSLTMSTQIKACSKAPRTLGLGDVRGLEVRY
ncbi:MAG: hypothetical protein M3323_08550 [Actinomycetota bacterium]|nr:hypothetical protein [Actinomycetota bacterium]